MGKIKFNASNCIVGFALVLLVITDITAGKRIFSGSSRKSSSSNSGRVTPSYGGGSSSSSNTHGGTNSHADVAKLSYPNYNSQPNRPASTGGQQQPPAYGWNAPKQQGPPPAYSANNPAGGAKTNMHEAPPVYHAPPSYAAPPPGATYHQPDTCHKALLIIHIHPDRMAVVMVEHQADIILQPAVIYQLVALIYNQVLLYHQALFTTTGATVILVGLRFRYWFNSGWFRWCLAWPCSDTNAHPNSASSTSSRRC